LKINQTPRFRFLHSKYTIPSLMHWRNLTQQAHLHNVSGLPFSCFLACHSQENLYTTSARSVAQHHGKSTECMSCTFTHFYFMDTCNLGVCLSSSLYLSCLLVCATVMFANHAFTNMDRPMRRWLHWKYHFMWDDPCTVSLGVGVVLSLSCLLACMFSYFFVCLLACLFVFLLTLHTHFLLLFSLHFVLSSCFRS